MRIIIDGLMIKNKKQFHECIKNKMEFPEYYGNNLDALWDCLTGWIELPIEVEWRNFKYSKEQLGEYSNKIIEVFKEAEEELGEEFKFILI